jgi:hypothetical protein
MNGTYNGLSRATLPSQVNVTRPSTCRAVNYDADVCSTHATFPQKIFTNGRAPVGIATGSGTLQYVLRRICTPVGHWAVDVMMITT